MYIHLYIDRLQAISTFHSLYASIAYMYCDNFFLLSQIIVILKQEFGIRWMNHCLVLFMMPSDGSIQCLWMFGEKKTISKRKRDKDMAMKNKIQFLIVVSCMTWIGLVINITTVQRPLNTLSSTLCPCSIWNIFVAIIFYSGKKWTFLNEALMMKWVLNNNSDKRSL